MVNAEAFYNGIFCNWAGISEQELRRRIGDQIKQIRKSLNLNQKGFVRKYNSVYPLGLQITAQDLSKYETGVNNMPSDKYVKLLSI